MTTTKITPSEQIGIRLIDPTEIDEIGWREPDLVLIRIWVKDKCLKVYNHNWKDLPLRYVLEWVKQDLSYSLRPQDSVRDLGVKFMIRDIYIKSTLLEKLYD